MQSIGGLVILVLVCTHLCCVRKCTRVPSVCSVCVCVILRLQSILVGWGCALQSSSAESGQSVWDQQLVVPSKPATPSSTPQGELHPVSDLF